MHRVRSCRVARRTSVCNEIRALCTEAGIVFAKGPSHVRKLLPAIVADESNELTPTARRLIQDLYSELLSLDDRIDGLTKELERACERATTRRCGNLRGRYNPR